MAFETIAIFVMGHGNAAVRALHGCAATAANDAPGIAAAVDQDKSLSLEIETLLNCLVQARGNRAGLVGLLEFFA